MSVQITELSMTGLLHLRGQKISQALTEVGGDEMLIFSYRKVATNQFIARLGVEEFLINLNNFDSNVLNEKQYAFQRGDVVFELSGNWRALMSEVCIYDFRQASPGDFAMVSVAGVSVWMLIPDDASLVVGCDPTYGHYLLTTLQKQIDSSPFLKIGV